MNRSRPTRTKFETNRGLRRYVEARLKALDSPTTIAIELARSGGISEDVVSPETIYLAVYAHGTRDLAAGIDPHRDEQDMGDRRP